MSYGFQSFERRFTVKGYASAELKAIYNDDDCIKEKIVNGKLRFITENDVKHAIERLNKRRNDSLDKLFKVNTLFKNSTEQEVGSTVSKSDREKWLTEMTLTDDYSGEDDNDDDDDDDDQKQDKLIKENARLKKKLKRKDKHAHTTEKRTAAYCMQALGISTKKRKSIWQTLDDVLSEIRELKKIVILNNEQNKRHVELERITTNLVPGVSEDPITQKNIDVEAALKLFNNLVQCVKTTVKPFVENLQQQVQRVSSADDFTINYERFLCNAADVADQTLRIIDNIVMNGSFSKRMMTIDRKERSAALCPGFNERIVITFDDIHICPENGINTRPSVIDNNLELCDCSFTATSKENRDNVSNVSGVLTLTIDASLVLTILTDKDWRPPVKLYRNESFTELGNLATGILSNRVLYLLRYLLHSFTHFVCVVHPELQNACFDHPHNAIYEEIANFFEPRRLLQA